MATTSKFDRGTGRKIDCITKIATALFSFLFPTFLRQHVLKTYYIMRITSSENSDQPLDYLLMLTNQNHLKGSNVLCAFSTCSFIRLIIMLLKTALVNFGYDDASTDEHFYYL